MLMSLLRLSAPLVLLALVPIAMPGLLAESPEQAQGQPPQPPPQAGANAPCSVAGMVAAGQARLPGVIVSVTPAAGGAALTTSTGLDGRYHVAIPGPGRFVVKAELAAFATVTKDVSAEAPCQARLDIVMTLASRVPASAPVAPSAPSAAAAGQAPVKPAAGAPAAPAAAAAQPQAAGARGAGSQRPASGQFQRVGATGASNQQGQTTELTVTTEDTRALAEGLNLPPGFTPETMSDTVTAFGRTGQTNDMLLFGPGGMGMFGGREGMPGMPGLPGSVSEEGAAGGVTGFSAAPGGPGGGPGRPRWRDGRPRRRRDGRDRRRARRRRWPRRRTGRRGGGGRGGPAALGDRLALANRMRQDRPRGRRVLPGRRISPRRGAVFADREPGHQAGLPAAAVHRIDWRPVQDPEALRPRLAHVVLPELLRQPLEQLLERLLDGAQPGASQRRLLGLARDHPRPAHAAALSRQRDPDRPPRSVRPGAPQVHPAAEPGGRAAELLLLDHEHDDLRRHQLPVRADVRSPAAGRARRRRARGRRGRRRTGWRRRRRGRGESERLRPLATVRQQPDRIVPDALRQLNSHRMGRPGQRLVHRLEDRPFAPRRLQPERDADDQRVRQRDGRRRQRGNQGRIDRSVRLGRPLDLVLDLLGPSRHHAVDAQDADGDVQRLDVAHVQTAQPPMGPRLPARDAGQPDEQQPARLLRVHRPLHGPRHVAGDGHRPRRLPARPAAAGLAAVRAWGRAAAVELGEPVLPGRLARVDEPHAQRRRCATSTNRRTARATTSW